VPRNSTPYNAMADEIAGASRLAVAPLSASEPTIYEQMPLGVIETQQEALKRCARCKTPLGPGETSCPVCSEEEDTNGPNTGQDQGP
jgi:hypothetical protein